MRCVVLHTFGRVQFGEGTVLSLNMTIVDANSSSSVSFPVDKFELFHERLSGVRNPRRAREIGMRPRHPGGVRLGGNGSVCRAFNANLGSAAGCRHACVRACCRGYREYRWRVHPLVSRGIRSWPPPGTVACG